MITIEQIRKDLKEIRYYYSKQNAIDKLQPTARSSVLDKVAKYNAAVKDAPIRLYDLYTSLYIMNNTQESLSYDWDLTDKYIGVLNRKLCDYLLIILNN